MASNHDLNTDIDRTNGRRYYKKNNLNDRYIIHDAKDLKDNIEGNNNELVVTNIKITAIWITNDAKEESIKAAMYLANKYDLKVITMTHMFE
jgi:DNA-binding transcriptional MerR regulator